MLFKYQFKQSAVRLLLLISVIGISFAFQSASPAFEMEMINKNQPVAVQDTAFSKVDVPPSPVGGYQNFYNYVGRNYKYPKAAVTAQVEGKVIIQFVVERDGSLVEIKALEDLGFGTGEEAVRMLKSAPKWNPGIMDGKPVRVQFTLPIHLNKVKSKEQKRPRSTFR
jgi:outer membrane biosynthesis protein TonB